MLNYAPFEPDWVRTPKFLYREPEVDCNIIIVGFIGAFILMGIIDSLRK